MFSISQQNIFKNQKLWHPVSFPWGNKCSRFYDKEEKETEVRSLDHLHIIGSPKVAGRRREVEVKIQGHAHSSEVKWPGFVSKHSSSVLFDPKLSYSTTFLSLSSLAVKVVRIPFILQCAFLYRFNKNMVHRYWTVKNKNTSTPRNLP